VAAGRRRYARRRAPSRPQAVRRTWDIRRRNYRLSAVQTSRNIQCGKEKRTASRLESDIRRPFGFMRGDLYARHHRLAPVGEGVSRIHRNGVRPLWGVPSGIDSRIDGIAGSRADRRADVGLCAGGLRVVPAGDPGEVGSCRAFYKFLSVAPLFSGTALSRLLRETR
jgi:hypothetical protein